MIKQLETAGVEVTYVAKYFKKLGYRLLGKGSQGSVWDNGGTRVLKAMFTENANEYLKFVEFSKANKSKHVPKFYKIRRLSFDDLGYKASVPKPPVRYTGLVIVEVEKLSPKPKGFKPTDKDAASLMIITDLMHVFARKYNMRMDLGTGGNILLRGNTQVVADPFSN